MQFVIHGSVAAEVGAALAKKEHVCHTMPALEAAAAAPDSTGDPAGLMLELEKRQWNLLTNDAALVRSLYERKVAFGGVIVLVPAADADPEGTVDRLFERYRRLTPGRLYTVTPNRVKIRQLPGAGAHAGTRESHE